MQHTAVSGRGEQVFAAHIHLIELVHIGAFADFGFLRFHNRIQICLDIFARDAVSAYQRADIAVLGFLARHVLGKILGAVAHGTEILVRLALQRGTGFFRIFGQVAGHIILDRTVPGFLGFSCELGLIFVRKLVKSFLSDDLTQGMGLDQDFKDLGVSHGIALFGIISMGFLQFRFIDRRAVDSRNNAGRSLCSSRGFFGCRHGFRQADRRQQRQHGQERQELFQMFHVHTTFLTLFTGTKGKARPKEVSCSHSIIRQCTNHTIKNVNIQ